MTTSWRTCAASASSTARAARRRALRKSSRQSRMGGRIGRGGGGAAAVSDSGSYGVEIVLPEGRPRWTGGRCIAMSWIDGEPLLASRCCASLSPSGAARAFRHRGDALPDAGRGLHARRSPRRQPATLDRASLEGEGLLNRLLRRPPPPPRLAYLDFGLVSTVPQQVRDGLVCGRVPSLCTRHKGGRRAILRAHAPSRGGAPEQYDAPAARGRPGGPRPVCPRSATRRVAGGVSFPGWRFEKLITELALIAPRFRLRLPPYFLNNARALATLEGMAKSADESFDVLQAVYPFALRRLHRYARPHSAGLEQQLSYTSSAPLLSFPILHVRQRAPLTSLLLALRPDAYPPHNSRPQGLPAAADDAPRPHTRRRRPAGPIARVTDARRRRAPLRPAAQAAACRRHPYTRAAAVLAWTWPRYASNLGRKVLPGRG